MGATSPKRTHFGLVPASPRKWYPPRPSLTLFRVFTDRYERSSVLITSNLAFGDWNQVFQGERMTGALLDRLTHRCHIFEMNGESYRFRESMKTKKARKPA